MPYENAGEVVAIKNVWIADQPSKAQARSMSPHVICGCSKNLRKN
jgi:hypothetical protein